MTRARQDADWWHTAAVLAQLHNTSGWAKRAISPAECHPSSLARPRAPDLRCKVSILKSLFLDGGKVQPEDLIL
jgi:hypothetical protein